MTSKSIEQLSLEENPVAWEPYRLPIGQRVKIRLRGECPHSLQTNNNNKYGHTDCHREVMDGQEGIIINTDYRDKWSQTHRYEISFLYYFIYGHYTLSELEPI